MRVKRRISSSARDFLKVVTLNLCLAWSLEPFVWTVEPTKEELSLKLSTATRSMEHMNSLLHETEATNAVLMEQITVRIRTKRKDVDPFNFTEYSK